MHMLHMHISMDIIITLSFFITDFLLSSVLNGVSALDGGMVTLSVPFVNPLFYIPAICKKIRQQSPTVFVCFAARIILSYPPKHSLTCCAFTQRGMKKSHQAALDGSQSGTKAFFKNLLKNHTAITAQTASEITGAYQMALPPTVKASAASAAA